MSKILVVAGGPKLDERSRVCAMSRAESRENPGVLSQREGPFSHDSWENTWRANVQKTPADVRAARACPQPLVCKKQPDAVN
jgi:hypothetical protein